MKALEQSHDFVLSTRNLALSVGIYYTAPFIRNPGLWHHLNENWALIGAQLLFNRNPDEFDETDEKILEKVKEFYLGNSGEFNDDNIDKIVQMFGDAITFGGR